MQQLRPPHTFFVAEYSTNFPAVSQSGDDISRYQPPNSDNEGFFDNFFQKTLVLIFVVTSLLLFLSIKGYLANSLYLKYGSIFIIIPQ